MSIEITFRRKVKGYRILGLPLGIGRCTLILKHVEDGVNHLIVIDRHGRQHEAYHRGMIPAGISIIK